MNPKRKQVQDLVIKIIKKMIKGNENVTLYQNLFDSMSDKEFHTFMEELRDGKKHLYVVIPNDAESRVDVKNNFNIAKDLNFKFFKKIKFAAHDDIPSFILPEDALVMVMPTRIAQQTLDKKISIPEHSLSIDQLTGQVTGVSKASRLTLPENQILGANGLNNTIRELVKVRGGDTGAAKAYNDGLYKHGRVSQAEIKDSETGVVSTETLNSIFNAMMISTTLIKK